MHKIIISGGPHSGKTTTFNSLRGVYPGAYFVAEPAERVIARENAHVDIEPHYKPRVPMRDYPGFSPLVIAESLTLEREIPPDAELVIQDRSLIDNLGYGALNNFTEYFERLERFIASAQYTLAFFCEPVGEYAATAIRHETSDEARLTHDHLRAAYESSGLPIVHLPAVSVEDRLTIIQSTVAAL